MSISGNKIPTKSLLRTTVQYGCREVEQIKEVSRMTSNQIAAAEQRERARSNRENEREKSRSNRATEALTSAELNRKKARDKWEEKLGKVNAVTGGLANVGKAASPILGAFNDPGWYSLDKQLVDDTARVSYGTPLGIKQNLFSSLNTETPAGIMRIAITPTVMPGVNEATAVNVAARNIYSFVRHANSGSRNYESPDYMMYLLAMDSMYAYHMSLCRIYSAALTAKGENRYWGRAMLRALGCDPDSIVQNLSQLRKYINVLGVKLNSFYVPNTWSYITRHAWLVSNFFKDDPIKKSQLFVFDYNNYLQWGEDTSLHMVSSPTRVSPVTGSLPSATVTNLVTFGELLVQSLLTSEDIGIMSGDTLKAYGENELYYVNSINDDFHIEAVWSSEVLAQIAGATVCGEVTLSTAYIRQNSAGIIYQGESETTPLFCYSLFRYGQQINVPSGQGTVSVTGNVAQTSIQNWIVNMYKDDVSADDTMVSTRLTATVGPLDSYVASGSVTIGRFVTSCGSEIVNGLWVVSFSGGGSSSDPVAPNAANTVYGDVYIQTGNATTLLPSGTEVALQLALFSQFDWAPFLRLLSATYSSSGTGAATTRSLVIGSYNGTAGDIQNYAPVSQATLQSMHEVALLSEFGVPLLGAKVRRK